MTVKELQEKLEEFEDSLVVVVDGVDARFVDLQYCDDGTMFVEIS